MATVIRESGVRPVGVVRAELTRCRHELEKHMIYWRKNAPLHAPLAGPGGHDARFAPRESPLKHGRWSEEEHQLFLKLLEEYDRSWTKIASLIPQRSEPQVRSHAQKYFLKEAKRKDAAGAAPVPRAASPRKKAKVSSTSTVKLEAEPEPAPTPGVAPPALPAPAASERAFPDADAPQAPLAPGGLGLASPEIAFIPDERTLVAALAADGGAGPAPDDVEIQVALEGSEDAPASAVI